MLERKTLKSHNPGVKYRRAYVLNKRNKQNTKFCYKNLLKINIKTTNSLLILHIASILLQLYSYLSYHRLGSTKYYMFS